MIIDVTLIFVLDIADDSCGFKLGLSSVDVKTIEPKSDKGINTNFSISYSVIHDKRTPDYFAFVYKDEVYVVENRIVKENLFEIKKGTYLYYLFPLKLAVKYSIFTDKLIY